MPSFVVDAGIALAAFALGAALAAAAGTTNFGTALGVGQLAFAAAMTWILLRR